jgi:glycosyltransferase involved in cell wall biosynthesis
MTLMVGKPLFVRHCGTWGDRSTLANRILSWFLPRIAGGRVVVMATGGGPEPPEPGNPAIEWIFATSYSRAEYDSIVPAEPWIPGKPLRLVTVGRLTRGKNALSCVEALPAIRRALPGTTLTVVGDGPIRDQLARVASSAGVSNAVIFSGNLGHDEVLDTLCRSHIFLFPTRVAEGFPKAVLEAMACGLPVVASRVSVLPHLLGRGRGLLLDGTTPEDVASGVLDLAAASVKLEEMARRAREHAREYTLETWRDLIRSRLEVAWGRRLRDETSVPRPTAERIT